MLSGSHHIFPAAFTEISRLRIASCYYSTALSHHETTSPTHNFLASHASPIVLYDRQQRIHRFRHTICTRSACCLAVAYFHVELVPDPAFEPYVKLWLPSKALGRGGVAGCASISLPRRLSTVSLHRVAYWRGCLVNEADESTEILKRSASAIHRKMQDTYWLQMDSPQWRKREFLMIIAMNPAEVRTNQTNSKFVDSNSTITFYHRPQDQRARMLFSSTTTHGREKLHSVPLTSLTAVRDRSVIKLFRLSSHDIRTYKPWAELKFIHYERMVLFFSMFVALKRQDSHETPTQLIDDPAEKQGEDEHYGGVVCDNHKRHALRLLQCPGSGALRLEARPHRGDRREVPIWTAFLTKYAETNDPIFELQADRVTVSVIGLKPAPFVFVSEYRLPRTQYGDYMLRFYTKDGQFDVPPYLKVCWKVRLTTCVLDAMDFMTRWTTLCSRLRGRLG